MLEINLKSASESSEVERSEREDWSRNRRVKPSTDDNAKTEQVSRYISYLNTLIIISIKR